MVYAKLYPATLIDEYRKTVPRDPGEADALATTPERASAPRRQTLTRDESQAPRPQLDPRLLLGATR
jgi:hypothetical protein